MAVLLIRRAEESDVSAIIDICSAAWQSTYKELYPQSYIDRVIADYYHEERVTKEIRENTPYFHGYWVAEKDHQVIGCIGGGIDEQKAGHIYVFYMAPELKRQGVGTALLDGFTAYQKEVYGIKEQWISALTEGNHVGQAFYEKQGFVFQYAKANKAIEGGPRSLYLRRQL
ncbi:GNAT family N-acetyltransferase [Streptococcus plurextorum]|uniref:GNAT family N-acetyltransferase n=1 Tax=Streptococcus plurextorum TaxID=456876 RepID=UPI000420FDB9|nr:GNAT family N-acetyltransferase [Streptococcus plurextorum]